MPLLDVATGSRDQKSERLKIFSGALFIITKCPGNHTGKGLPQQRAT